MKKKQAKKGVIPRQSPRSRPPKVGGKSDVSAKVNWSRVGRRRLPGNDLIQSLGNTLKEYREAAGLTVAQLAKELQVAPATVIKFEEKGYPVSIKIVLAMATQLGCTLEVKGPGGGKKKKKR